MNREWMITKYHERIMSGIYEDSKLMELEILSSLDYTSDTMGRSILGNIYVGRVQNIVKNLNAAFVEIQKGIACYYPLDENTPIFLNPKSSEKIVVGDEILVQVTKEALKLKAPVVSSTLSLTGHYVVVEYGNKTVGISKKLERNQRILAIKHEIMTKLPSDYSVILRTNAGEAPSELILEEYEMLLQRLKTIVMSARYKTVYSCLYQGETDLRRIYQNVHNTELKKIITDIPEVYEDLQQIVNDNHPVLNSSESILTYYDPSEMQPLYAIYRFDRDYKEATDKRVWLKSGAYLVIEQTEAMVVIDVNTGKAINKNRREEHFLKINREAMTEIARQLRLRNLSGIIMIDFIDMEDPESKRQLIAHVQQEILKDRIPVKYIEMTKLDLVELTRKKVQKSLAEQIVRWDRG